MHGTEDTLRHDHGPDRADISPGQRRVVRLKEVRHTWPALATATVRLTGTVDKAVLESAAAAACARFADPLELATGSREPAVVRWCDTGADAEVADDARESGVPYVVIHRQAAEQHRLVITVPALAADMVSVVDVARGIVDELTDGADSGAAVPYRNVARWWSEMTTATSASSARQFWRTRTTGTSRPLGLPALIRDAGSPVESVSAEITGELLAGLRAAVDGGAMRTWLLAAWSVLLVRLGANAPTVGVGTDLRRHGELKGCVGPLTTYLPVRLEADLETPLVTVVDRLAKQLEADATMAEFFSWELCGDGEGGYRTGFDHVVAEDWSTGAFEAVVTDADWRGDAFDLRLSVVETTGSVRLRVEYDPNAVAPFVAGTMPESLIALLEDAFDDPHVRVGDVDVVGQDQRDLLRSWGTGAPASAADDFLPSVVRGFAAERPDAIAIRCGTEIRTYAELSTAADRLSHQLIEYGAGPQDVIGVVAPRSIDLVVGLLAVLGTGAAYLPIGPDQPVTRTATVLADAGARLVLVAAGLAEHVPDTVRAIVLAPQASEPWNGKRLHSLPDRAHQDSIAYMVSTSGSTGMPKTVMVTHGGLMNYLRWARDQWPLTGARGSVVASPIGFDFTVLPLFLPLLTGTSVTMLPESENPIALLAEELTSGHDYSIARVTPTGLRALIRELGDRRGAGMRAAVSARNLVVGGERLTAVDVQAWREVAAGTVLANQYGPCEAVVARIVMPAVADVDTHTVPIGRPIQNTRVLVLDRRLRPVPVGIPGEIFLGGLGLALGYARRPGLTADRFVPSPDGTPGSRLYRTGDLARWLPDGTLEFVARTDGQVKIRGFRVEPAEAERVLREHPDVANAVVTGRPDSAGEPRLVAYLVLEPGSEANATALRDHQLRQLPEYLVPSQYVFVAALAVSSNGKVDLQALPDPEPNRSMVRPSFVAPRSDAERILADIWSEVLKVDRVGVHENFYELGGDSILSILVTSRARASGLGLELRHFMEHQTVAGLAEVAVVVRAVPSAVVEDSGLLTPVQRAFFDRMPHHPGHWNQTTLFTLAENTDIDRLDAALRAVVDHHPALRTSFVADLSVAGGWRAVVAPAGAGPSALIRVEVPSDTAWEEGLARALEERSVFDLGTAPLLRAVHVVGAEHGQRRLAVIVHHLVVDFVSWRILLDDLRTAYGQLESGTEVRLAAITATPSEWGAALAAIADRCVVDLPYWTAQSPVTPVPLPLDHPAVHGSREADYDDVVVELDDEHTRTLLREVPSVWRAQVDDILLTALWQTVRDWTGADHLHVDVEGHGRAQQLVDGVDLYRSVGWFTSSAPVLLRLPERGGPADLVLAAKAQLHSRPATGLTYGVLRYLNPSTAERLSALPQPQIIYNYVGPAGSVADYSARATATNALGLDRAPERAPRPVHPDNAGGHPLSVNSTVVDGRLLLSLRYSRDRHDASTIERLAASLRGYLVALIDACVRGGASPLIPSDFPLLDVDQAALDGLIARARRARLPGADSGPEQLSAIAEGERG